MTGVDIAAPLLKKARELAADLPITFHEADARSLPFDDEAFDIITGARLGDSIRVPTSWYSTPHWSTCQVPTVRSPRRLGCCARVAGWRPSRVTTRAPPSQSATSIRCNAAQEAMMANSVTDRWLVRRLPALLRDCGLQVKSFRSHGFIDTSGDGYMVTVIDRGADLLATAGQIGADLAVVMKAEARRRASMGSFFGHIAYASLTAQKAF